ncbi:MAG: tRNA pseudouridine(55) synthase TruB [Elusimicrobia bacterium RIFOXYA2_FULL_58_8]|nr:MAG: tRNA pseudouridine(55) synthase TruB [Elusimicrobia bacterium RIFOXYA2_FULL_58_8]
MIPPASQPSGLLLFDKPKGITSHDAVAILRNKLSCRRIGPTGTLDPMATGLLVMLVGSATSAQERLQGASKTYSGTIMFGTETDTWDAEGQVTGQAAVPCLSPETVGKAVEAFSGKIVQQVPPYSAVRVNGQHLYKLARKNLSVPDIRREIQVRWVSWAARPPMLDFEIECSGGTYLRSIARELGLALGSKAHLSALRRLTIGGWSVADSVTTEVLSKLTPEAALARLQPVPPASC